MMSERDRQVLDFEGSWWLFPGPKDRAIREYLHMSATLYYQTIRRLIDDAEAESYAPMAVLRLRRMKSQRLEQIARRTGSDR
jgi:hypothetical protein